MTPEPHECELRNNDIESQCYSQCHAARDGDCCWPKCPQVIARQSHCPLEFLCIVHDRPKEEGKRVTADAPRQE